MTNLEKISETLTRLNWHYGKGNIGNVKLFLDGRLEFEQRTFSGKPQTRRGRVVDGTVFALGHQRRIAS